MKNPISKGMQNVNDIERRFSVPYMTSY